MDILWLATQLVHEGTTYTPWTEYGLGGIEAVFCNDYRAITFHNAKFIAKDGSEIAWYIEI
jgi:hypothetical protein